MRLNEVYPSIKELGTTATNNNNYCCQWFWYTCACMEFHMLWAVVLIYQCGRKKEHFVWSVKWFLFPPFPTICFPLCISVMRTCLLVGLGAHDWIVRFCQLLVQSSSWSWLPIAEAPGCLGHRTST